MSVNADLERNEVITEETSLVQKEEEEEEDDGFRLEDVDDEVIDFLQDQKTIIIATLLVIIYLVVGSLVYYFAEPEWDYIDALYFCVATLTTVGYGDFHPTTALTRIFTVCYILFGIGMIGAALGVVGGYLLERQEAALVTAIQTAKKTAHHHERDDDDDNEIAGINKSALFKLGISVLVLVIFIGIGTLYYTLTTTDGNVVDGFYFTIVTTTTVGYGDIVPLTTWQKVFSIPFLLLGTLFIAGALGTFADVFISSQNDKMAKRVLNKNLTVSSILAMDTDADGGVDLAEFIEHMLVHMNKCSKEDIQEIKDQFKKLDADGSGVLDKNDILVAQKNSGI